MAESGEADRLSRASAREGEALPATSGEVGGPLCRPGEIEARSRAIETLTAAAVPFMVAGAYAFFEYTGIFRDTKDLDLMLLERDLPAAFGALDRAGFQTELVDPAWIGKAYAGESFIDLIFSSSNGLATVDALWFENARPATVLGQPCLVAPVEEIIFTKAFVDERERYDGADVNHLIYVCGAEMNWERLLERFGPHWEVLFAHLTLYRFVYPGARSRVPEWLVQELCRRTMAQARAGDAEQQTCRGNLISTRQYRHDYEKLGLSAEGPASAESRPTSAPTLAPHVGKPHGRKRRRLASSPPRLIEVGDAELAGIAVEEAGLRKPAS